MHTSFNPVATASAAEICLLCRAMVTDGMAAPDIAELEDQLEATIPALIELRDAGHIELNMKAIAETATMEGWMRLADNTRLSNLSRNRAAAIRDRYLTQGVKNLLGL